MTAVIAVAALAPVHRDRSPRAEQVTQLVLGETGIVLEQEGEWRRVRATLDGYTGWVHTGYLRELDPAERSAWAGAAWSDGARVDLGDRTVALPLRARVLMDGPAIVLPDGGRGRVIAGAVRPGEETDGLPPEAWARQRFAGAPYLWGGVTPWGVDCSGLVQTTFLARGLVLPRDARDQAEAGERVEPGDRRPGDLMFFADDSGRIDHVSFAGPGGVLIHATLRRGGVVVEPPVAGSGAGRLLERLVRVRRIRHDVGAP